jgi:hypothetical protein
MKLYKVIDFLKWFFAFAVFGVAVYAIYQAWTGVKAFIKPSNYASDPAKGQTKFEKYFPNVAEAKDKVLKGSGNTMWGAYWDSFKANFTKKK